MRLDAEKMRILTEKDVDAFITTVRRETGVAPSSRFAAEIAIHKARCTYRGTDAALVEESRAWLASHGFEVPGE